MRSITLKCLAYTTIIFTALLVGCTTATPTVHIVNLTDANLTVELKKGESCEKYYLLIFGPVGNKSVIDAAKQGKVTKIKSVDYATEEYGIYSKNCVYVYGE